MPLPVAEVVPLTVLDGDVLMLDVPDSVPDVVKLPLRDSVCDKDAVEVLVSLPDDEPLPLREPEPLPLGVPDTVLLPRLLVSVPDGGLLLLEVDVEALPRLFDSVPVGGLLLFDADTEVLPRVFDKV